MQRQLFRMLYCGEFNVDDYPHNLQFIQILDMIVIVLPLLLFAHLLFFPF